MKKVDLSVFDKASNKQRHKLLVESCESEELVSALLEQLIPSKELLRDDMRLNTPIRYVKMLKSILSGFSEGDNILRKTFNTSEHGRNMVTVCHIPFYSLCEHHLAPFFGKCHIGYIPNNKVAGLSKFPRLVNKYSKRTQLQERLTDQIANEIELCLQPSGLMVITEARHFCMEMRGVEKHKVVTKCSAIRGCFEKPEIRAEFLKLIEDRDGTL